MLFRLFHSFLEPKFSTQSLTSAFWASANPVSCQCHAATPLQDDMIEGEMFKQLGVKEEDKESDEEAARFVSLVPYGWFGFAFPFTRRTLEHGPSTPDLAGSSRFPMVPSKLNPNRIGLDRSCTKSSITVDDGTAASRAKKTLFFFPWNDEKTNKQYTTAWESENCICWRPGSSGGVVSDAGAPLPVGPCHDSKPRSGVDKRLKAIVQTQRMTKDDQRMRN